MKKYRAIGNRGYTNEVRLRGLSETREGGFSLYVSIQPSALSYQLSSKNL